MKYIKSIYIGLVGLLMTACQTEQWEASQGSLCITLAEDVSISTKSTPAELGKPTAERFTLNIIKESTGENIYNGTYKQTIPAYTGAYTVTATYGTDFVIALDSPYYKGEATGVEVEVNQSTPVTLTCKVANALASVAYGEGQKDKFDELFSTYGVEVKVGNSSVTIGRNGSTTQSAYYRAGSTPTFTFKGTLKENNQNVSMEITSDKLTADAFQAGQHCKLTLSLKPATAGAIITVEKVEVETVTISETIPVEWLPAPKINATGFDENKSLTIYETGDAASASIDFTVSQPLQDLSFTLNFADENLSALNKTYQLSTMTDEEKIALSDAGITLPLIGSNDPKITFPDTFISKLQSQNNSVVNNTITINSVTANNRSNTDGAQTYTIAVHKPEFSVSVLPGNIWSKEFTVEEITVEEGKGNLEKIKENLVYQYQDADGNWNNCSNQDTRQQIFTEHPQNRNYKVRALYRGSLASNEVSLELESQTQLENSGMEDWFLAETDWEFPNYIPRISSSTTEYWDTNNEFTFRYNIPWPKDWYDSSYNGFPAVSYSTTNKHTGNRSAELRNTAAGPAGTSSVVYDNNRIAGMLFYGNYTGTTSTSFADGNIDIEEGRSFNVRPTKLSFWYTYEPYNGNEQDTYEVIIRIFDADGNIIGEGNHTSNQQITSWSNQTIDITYKNDYVEKATKIYVCFQSSNAGQGNVPYEKKREITLSDSGNYTTHYGSILRIDDISLIYDK